MRIRTAGQAGFTLAEIMIVVAIIGLLAAIAIPNFVKARTVSQKNACLANLRQLDGAKSMWALEAKKFNNDSCAMTDVVGPNLYLKEQPACPAGGNYTLGTVGTKTICSFSGHTL